MLFFSHGASNACVIFSSARLAICEQRILQFYLCITVIKKNTNLPSEMKAAESLCSVEFKVRKLNSLNDEVRTFDTVDEIAFLAVLVTTWHATYAGHM